MQTINLTTAKAVNSHFSGSRALVTAMTPENKTASVEEAALLFEFQPSRF
jgi:hypothetical protein